MDEIRSRATGHAPRARKAYDWLINLALLLLPAYYYHIIDSLGIAGPQELWAERTAIMVYDGKLPPARSYAPGGDGRIRSG